MLFPIELTLPSITEILLLFTILRNVASVPVKTTLLPLATEKSFHEMTFLSVFELINIELGPLETETSPCMIFSPVGKAAALWALLIVIASNEKINNLLIVTFINILN